MISPITVVAVFVASGSGADPIGANASIASSLAGKRLMSRTRRDFAFALPDTAAEISDAASAAYFVLRSSFPNNTATIPFQNGTWPADQLCEVESDPPEEFGVAEKVFLVLTLGVLIAAMIVGNILVILAIVMERELQRAQYYLVLSLAVADLMVGVVVSPLAALYDINRQWHLGVPMCDFWILSDVMACTSSILHLVAIALDRYWSITDVSYMQKRTARRIGYMIMVVWAISFCVSVAPMLGWKDSQFHCRVEVRNECLISQDPSYQIFSTTTAFYAPLVLICILYWKIYKAAKRRIQMQVKRRSNTMVTQVRAKILAFQQQQERENQEALSSVERLEPDDSDNVGSHSDNGDAAFANGRLPHVKQKLQPRRSNVQIRLIQPSYNEPTATCVEAEPISISGSKIVSRLCVIKSGGTSSSLSDVEDESPEEDTAGITNSTLVGTRSSDADEPPSSTVRNTPPTAAASSKDEKVTKKCNGATPRYCATGGGIITMGPGGSVDFSTEDEAEYIDDWQAPSPLAIERKRSSLTPTAPVVPRSPKFSTGSMRIPRPSTLSQSEVTSTTFTGPAPTITSKAASMRSQRTGRFRTKKESAESSRERRAGRTLAIITGIFVVSWLPFFILALMRPLCGAACAVPRPIDSVFVWLGYVNSAINPVIYTIFSPDFRNAFKRTLQRCIVRRA